MNEEMIPPREMFLGPGTQELPSAGLHVEEPAEVESIEIAGRQHGRSVSTGWETEQHGLEQIDLMPDPEFDLVLDAAAATADLPPPSYREQRLEHENLQLAAELAALRAAGAGREQALEARVVELADRLERCEREIADQSDQIASLTLERDGLRARLEQRAASAAPAPERRRGRTDVSMQRLEESGRALDAAREELEAVRAERARLAEALAARDAEVVRLREEAGRRDASRRPEGDVRGALRRLLDAARRRPAGAAASVRGAEDGAAAESGMTDTIVIGEPPEPAAPGAGKESRAAVPRRFLLSLEPGSGEAHELEGSRVYVGRAPEAGIRITDTTVSRVHAILRVWDDQVLVEDAASTNGVFVNGLRVRAAVLNDYDTVTFGNVGYLFRLGPASEDATSRGQ